MTEIKFDSKKHIMVETDSISINGLPVNDAITELNKAFFNFIIKENPINICFKVDIEDYYGDSYPIIKFTGFRDKTDGEINIEKQRLERIKNNKYQEYIKLKKEFENE